MFVSFYTVGMYLYWSYKIEYALLKYSIEYKRNWFPSYQHPENESQKRNIYFFLLSVIVHQLIWLLLSQNLVIVTSVSYLPDHYFFLLSLQVNFVAAIDVYEDGEAGLLLCYNCK